MWSLISFLVTDTGFFEHNRCQIMSENYQIHRKKNTLQRGFCGSQNLKIQKHAAAYNAFSKTIHLKLETHTGNFR